MRRRELVKPDSMRPMKGFEVLDGLSGTHKTSIESWVREVGNTWCGPTLASLGTNFGLSPLWVSHWPWCPTLGSAGRTSTNVGGC